MKGWTVGDVYALIDAIAPFDTAVPGDNVGLLVGGMDKPVDTILTALDATPGVVREARELGAQLLVTHHPVMFLPRTRLDEADPEAALLCEMIRSNVAMIAAHTNLDVAPTGISARILQKAGWPAGEADGLFRMGAFDAPVAVGTLEGQVSRAFCVPFVRYGNPDRVVTRFAVCGGSGNACVALAAKAGAEVFLTGEIKHENALDAVARGMAVLAGGHRATEICAADILAGHLQSVADAVQLNVRVIVSRFDPFA